jgi:hypothetical protein
VLSVLWQAVVEMRTSTFGIVKMLEAIREGRRQMLAQPRHAENGLE